MHPIAPSFGHFIKLGKPPGVPISGKPFTVCAWIKAEEGEGVVVARGGAMCGFALCLVNGRPRFGIRRSAAEEAVIASADAEVSDGWAHLAGTLDQRQIAVYVNGKLAASARSPGLMTGNCGQSMEIGCDLSNSSIGVDAPFHGVIDEVRIYHSALTEADLADLVGRKNGQ
jgi:beta-galactosidase